MSCYILMWLVFSLNVSFLLYCASLFRKKMYNAALRCFNKKYTRGDASKDDQPTKKNVAVNIEMNRTSTIHANPLSYRSSFVKKQETENPYFGASVSNNPASTHARKTAHQTVRKSSIEEFTSKRLLRIRKIRESQRVKEATSERSVGDTFGDDDVEEDMFISNPMMKRRAFVQKPDE